jgi:hypothetical protein
MKKLITISFILIAGCYKLSAQPAAEENKVSNDKFITAMETNLKMLDTANAPSTLIMLANNFERIGKAEQKQWQPFYYASFCYAMMASGAPDKTKIDFLAEKAESFLTLAEAIDKNNSEISTLHGMIIYSKILVDPISRWQTMGKEAAGYLAKAKEQNPANPRPYLIEGRATLYTPEALGGGAAAAKPIAEECIKKFDAFVPDNTIAPKWGKSSAKKLLAAVSPK